MRLLSPAKINLYFHVLQKRADGFHSIRSQMQAVSLFDTLDISLSFSDEFTTSHSFPDNLALKALQLFRKTTDIHDPVAIHLEKKIPIQAGLGGGSGNAATTLFGLNELFDRPLSLPELKTLGATLGSDVAFFFTSGAAHASGRGEILTDAPPFPQKLTLAKPDFGLSTPEVFAHAVCRTNDSHFVNDLEIPAFRLCPDLKTLKEKLYAHGYTHVLMTGSGTTFYCVGDLAIPQIKGVTFFDVSPIKRLKDSWYAS